MQFMYESKRYDLRLKSRYLPKGIRAIGSLDLMIMLSSRTSDEMKLSLLQSYLPGAELAGKVQ